MSERNYYVHPSAYVDEPCEIGAGTKIWHFCHVMSGARLGQDCNIGQNVFIAGGVTIGNNVKIQNNVAVYAGVMIEDDVFLGPSMVFTNVINPRSHVPRRDEYQTTLVRQGASIGANATVVCGATLGRYAFVGAGAVITRDVPDYALVYGNPARIRGWMCQCGLKLQFTSDKKALEGLSGTQAKSGETYQEWAICQSCGHQYVKRGELVTPIEPEGV
jgi:UDP-2-acetamido-3-amino-2,3-dideoxy-glucuronate N-acetyltransferase